MKREKLYSIDRIYENRGEHHLYGIHPTYDDNLISGYIETYNNKLIDWEDKREYTEEEIYQISVWEEENKVFYVKII